MIINCDQNSHTN